MATHTASNSQATSTRGRASRTASRRTKGEVSLDDVQEDLRVVSRDIAQLRSDATDAAVQEVRRKAESALESARAVTEKAKEAHEKAADWVSEHPTASILVAVGIGALAARILFRR